MTRPAPTVTVPVEPTEAMKIAGVHAIDNVQPNDVSMWVTACWSAMISAAPAAPQAAGVGEDELIERGLRTIRAYDTVRYLRDALSATTARLTGYDWNADPEGLTKQQGDAFAAADRVFADLSAAVDAHPDIELPECQSCGGTGKIEEAARTEGANQHSACVRTCDDCDGCGFASDDESEALRAPSREPEGGARRFRHWARGTTYVEVGEARLQQSGQFGPCEGDAITVYRGEDGQLWARASSEFHDGRFEELPALATREEAPAEAGSFEERAIMLVRKHGDPNGSDYEQGQNDMGHRMVTMAREADALLRAQPPAREDAQPVGWLRVADEEMVCAHLGVAEAEDSYETAKKKLASLIQWNIAVAMDPSVVGHPAPDALRVAVEASGFLLDRLKDLEQDVNERDFYGHVHPAAARLRLAIAALQAEQGAK